MENLNDTIPAIEAIPQTDDAGRRTFFKTAAATAATVVIGGGLAEKASAQGTGPGGHIQVVVKEGNVRLDELHAALDVIINSLAPSGCSTCGLVGFDLSFLRGDPPLDQLRQFPGIQSGLITRAR